MSYVADEQRLYRSLFRGVAMVENQYPNGTERNASRNEHDLLAELNAVLPLNAYMVQLANVMVSLSHQLVTVTKPNQFTDRSRLAELVKSSREASALGKKLLTEVSNQRNAPMERYVS